MSTLRRSKSVGGRRQSPTSWEAAVVVRSKSVNSPRRTSQEKFDQLLRQKMLSKPVPPAFVDVPNHRPTPTKRKSFSSGDSELKDRLRKLELRMEIFNGTSKDSTGGASPSPSNEVFSSSSTDAFPDKLTKPNAPSIASTKSTSFSSTRGGGDELFCLEKRDDSFEWNAFTTQDEDQQAYHLTPSIDDGWKPQHSAQLTQDSVGPTHDSSSVDIRILNERIARLERACEERDLAIKHRDKSLEALQQKVQDLSKKSQEQQSYPVVTPTTGDGWNHRAVAMIVDDDDDDHNELFRDHTSALRLSRLICGLQPRPDEEDKMMRPIITPAPAKVSSRGRRKSREAEKTSWEEVIRPRSTPTLPDDDFTKSCMRPVSITRGGVRSTTRTTSFAKQRRSQSRGRSYSRTTTTRARSQSRGRSITSRRKPSEGYRPLKTKDGKQTRPKTRRSSTLPEDNSSTEDPATEKDNQEKENKPSPTRSLDRSQREGVLASIERDERLDGLVDDYLANWSAKSVTCSKNFIFL